MGLDDRDVIVLGAVHDLGGRMVRPSVLHDRLKWDYHELYTHIHHCERAGRLDKTVVVPRGLVGYRLIGPEERRKSFDALADALYREMRLDRGRTLNALDRLMRLLVDPPRRKRGRPWVSRGGVGVPLGSVLIAGEQQRDALALEELREDRAFLGRWGLLEATHRDEVDP